MVYSRHFRAIKSLIIIFVIILCLIFSKALYFCESTLFSHERSVCSALKLNGDGVLTPCFTLTVRDVKLDVNSESRLGTVSDHLSSFLGSVLSANYLDSS